MFRRVAHAGPSTTDWDRKRIVRLMFEDVTLIKDKEITARLKRGYPVYWTASCKFCIGQTENLVIHPAPLGLPLALPVTGLCAYSKLSTVPPYRTNRVWQNSDR